MSDDSAELRRLAFDLGNNTAETVLGARKIVEVAAAKIKKGMRDDASGIQHAPAFPASITYDLRGLSAEIGPDKDRRQGALGNILYFGTSNNAPVIPDIAAPLRSEAVIVERLLGDLGGKIL